MPGAPCLAPSLLLQMHQGLCTFQCLLTAAAACCVLPHPQHTWTVQVQRIAGPSDDVQGLILVPNCKAAAYRSSVSYPLTPNLSVCLSHRPCQESRLRLCGSMRRFLNNELAFPKPPALGFKFYAGTPLIASTGHRFGTLCAPCCMQSEGQSSMSGIASLGIAIVVAGSTSAVALHEIGHCDSGPDQCYTHCNRRPQLSDISLHAALWCCAVLISQAGWSAC